ncbi:MAG: hypothetical protein GX149_02950 [Acholeplasmataceae bacterium]|jgi:DNA polymerase-3 subunit delta'|nr:hypothetical protein [Acholeplasmataceae bacterium]
MKKKNIALLVNKFNLAIQNKRLSHLYLINGLKGSGKKILAFEIASLLLEASVEELEKGHINLYFLEPEGQNIRVEQIQRLQVEFSKTSLVRGYRVFILNRVERLNPTSANKLLKFLEEPVNKNIVGFLLTENKDQVISTILSRAQEIYLPAQSEKELTAQLIAGGIDKLTAELLPVLNKDIEILFSMSEDPNIQLVVKEFTDFTNALVSADNIWLYTDKHLKDIRYNKDLVSIFLQFLLVFYLDIFKTKNNEEVTIESFIEHYLVLKTLKNELLQEKLTKTQEILQKINYNINIDMAFSQLILDLS